MGKNVPLQLWQQRQLEGGQRGDDKKASRESAIGLGIAGGAGGGDGRKRCDAMRCERRKDVTREGAERRQSIALRALLSCRTYDRQTT